MGLIINLLLSAIGGYVSHVLFYRPTAAFGPRWGSLMRYAVGYLCIVPLRQLFLKESNTREDILQADILSAIAYGGGVFGAYLADKEE